MCMCRRPPAHHPLCMRAARACKDDVAKLCNSTWLFGKQDSAVIACLR